MKNLSIEQNALISLLSRNLFSASCDLPENIDWEKVVKESLSQTVFVIAFDNYKELSIDGELASRIKKALMKHTLSNADCFKNHTYLHQLLTKNGISYCAVKGAASASYYPDPILRGMGDVDFYVHPDDIERALEIFKDAGFERDSVNHPSHISLKNGAKHLQGLGK